MIYGKYIIAEKIRKIIAEILRVNEESIQEDTAIGDIPSWDSLNQLRILAAVESEFGIQFTPDVLMEMEDFSDIVRAVEERAGR